MSWEAIYWAYTLESTRLSAAEELILLHLAYFYRPEGGAYPATKTLARRTNLGTRYVNELLDSLIEKGLISLMATGPHSRCFDLCMEGKKEVKTVGAIAPAIRAIAPTTESYSSSAYNDDQVLSDHRLKHKGHSPFLKPKKLPRRRLTTREFLEGKNINVQDILNTLPRIENVEQAKQKLSSQITQRNLSATATPKLLWEYWRDLHAVLYPGVMIPVGTRATQSMLHKACEQIGPTFIEVLPVVLADWAGFVVYLTSMVGGKGATRPTVTVIARHPAVMVSYVNSLQKTVNPGAVAPQPPKGLTKYTEIVDTPLTAEDKAEIMRLLIEFDVNGNGNSTE